MIDPTRDRQLRELEQVNLCAQILYQARNELYLNMRFLDIPLSSLGFEAEWGLNGIRTDGFNIYYGPDWLTGLYGQGRVRVNRAYLHMLFHCLGRAGNIRLESGLRHRHGVGAGRALPEVHPRPAGSVPP